MDKLLKMCTQEIIQAASPGPVEDQIQGFGPMLAHEKPVEKEKPQLSKESVRKPMIAGQLRKAREAKQCEFAQFGICLFQIWNWWLLSKSIDIQASNLYNPPMTIRILLVDDHSVVRQGLRMFLSLDPDLRVVSEASNGVEGIEQVRKFKPDVVLMDLLMPVMDGITAIQQLRKEFPDVEVIALTSVLEDEKVIGAVRAGAIGYLLKDTQADELCRAIKAAANGQVQLSPQAAARLVREIKALDSPEKLTERETDVLRLLASGRSNKEIANELVIGEKTVKTHVSNILMKLGLTSRTQAALHAVRIGLVSG